MGSWYVKVYPTIKNWSQTFSTFGFYVHATGPPGGGLSGQYSWVSIEGEIAGRGLIPCTKTLYSTGGWARQGRMYTKRWQRGILWPGPHNVWCAGYYDDYTCEVTFAIPNTPEGAVITFARWQETTSAGVRTVVASGDIVAGGNYVYVPERVDGSGANWHTLVQPDEPNPNEYWDYGPHYVWNDRADTGIPPIIGIAYMELWYDHIEEPDNNEDVTNITDTEADLEVDNECEEAWFEYGIEGQEKSGYSETPHQYTQGRLTFHLTGLTPCTNYWFRFKQICDGVEKTGTTYWFKTKCTGTMEAITLGADDWWWMGGGQGLVRGLIRHTGNMNFYGYFGFQFRANDSSFTLADTVWLGNQGNESSSWIPPDPWQWPYQHIYNHLLPDRTYYYRAIWHIGRPPMTVDLYGATMSFSGVQSIAGYGYNHVTAKKAEDDISKMAAGRYYIDKSGVFQYESYQRRLA
jgi:hypothetical protein